MSRGRPRSQLSRCAATRGGVYRLRQTFRSVDRVETGPCAGLRPAASFDWIFMGELMVERWRIVIGSDGDGLAYKDALKADMKADSRVARVIDVGARAGKRTPYQSVAVAAARELMEGR